MRISNMTLAERGLPATRQQITDNLFAALQRLDYVPATVTMPGDPAFEPGTAWRCRWRDGTAPEMLVTHFVWLPRAADPRAWAATRFRRHNGRRDRKKRCAAYRTAPSKRIVYYSFTEPGGVGGADRGDARRGNCLPRRWRRRSAMFLAQLLLDAAPDIGKVLTLTVRYYM